MPLPREVTLIIEDISNHKEHLLEWEVFGNSTEDMRVVLTWRHVAGSIKSLPPTDNIQKWKLRQTSFSTDDAGDSLRNSPMDFESDMNLRKNNNADLKSDMNSKKNNNVDLKNDMNSKKSNNVDLESDINSKKNSTVDSGKQESTSDDSKTQKQKEEESHVKKVDANKAETKQKSNEGNKDGNDSSRDSPKDLKPKKKNPFRKVKKDEKSVKKGKLNLNLSMDQKDDVDNTTEDKNKTKLMNQNAIDDTNEKDNKLENNKSKTTDANKNADGNKNENQNDKSKEKNDDQHNKNESSEQNKNAEDEKKSVNVIKLEDDEGVKRNRRPGYDENQEWSRRKESIDGDTADDQQTKNENQKSEQSDINEEEKKRRQREHEEQEKKRRQKEQEEQEKKRRQKEHEEQEKKRRQREHEEQEWKRREKEKNDNESKEKEDNELSKEEQEKQRKELIEKTRKEVEELQAIDEETTEMKETKSETGAQKLLHMQREKFKMSIDEEALELVKASAEENRDLVNGSEMNGDVDLSNLDGDVDSSNNYTNGPEISDNADISKLSAWTSQDENTSAKDKRKVLKKSKDIKDEESYKRKSRSKANIVTIDLPPISEIKPVYEMLGRTEWENCVDCRYNGFCDTLAHKREYVLILLSDSKYNQFDSEDCNCIVCNGGAVHNGCVYRELLRLKTDYKLFDKRNFCVCKVCVPFKYRKLCLRQELRLMKEKGKDLYYRLTYDGDDGKEGYHPHGYDSDDSNYHSEEEDSPYARYIDALCLDDVDLDITKDDKISFRNCIDCQFNGFCDDIRHKKLYIMLLRIDDEDFDDLEDECGCLVCEYRGAAHNGCVLREIRRLKYDLLLFDKRNLCDCKQCIPFKYRQLCLRQEIKLLRRFNDINLYKKI